MTILYPVPSCLQQPCIHLLKTPRKFRPEYVIIVQLMSLLGSPLPAHCRPNLAGVEDPQPALLGARPALRPGSRVQDSPAFWVSLLSDTISISSCDVCHQRLIHTLHSMHLHLFGPVQMPFCPGTGKAY